MIASAVFLWNEGRELVNEVSSFEKEQLSPNNGLNEPFCKNVANVSVCAFLSTTVFLSPLILKYAAPALAENVESIWLLVKFCDLLNNVLLYFVSAQMWKILAGRRNWKVRRYWSDADKHWRVCLLCLTYLETEKGEQLLLIVATITRFNFGILDRPVN